MCNFTHLFWLFLNNNTDEHGAQMMFTRDTRKFHFSQQVNACLNVPLREHFCVTDAVWGSFRVSFWHRLRHVCVLCAEFRTFRRRPFWFWPTNRTWKVPWRRRRSPSVSHSTTSQHTRGTSKPAALWREKGEWNTHTHLTHSHPVWHHRWVNARWRSLHLSCLLPTSSLPASLDWMKAQVVAN